MIYALKAIGIFVVLLLIALGVGTFLLTREPSRELDAQGRTWVSNFSTWHNEISRPLASAVATTGGSREAGLSAQQVKFLRACTSSLAQLGSRPRVLDAVAEDANAACGQIEFALSLDAKYGSSARATTWDHLRRAESLLAVSKTNLRKLTASASDA
jgi:hypothetical protein